MKPTKIAMASLGAAAALAALPCAAPAQSNITVAYTYDSQGRIATQTYSNGVIVTYVYDPSGNLTGKTVKATKVVVVNLNGTFVVLPVP